MKNPIAFTPIELGAAASAETPTATPTIVPERCSSVSAKVGQNTLKAISASTAPSNPMLAYHSSRYFRTLFSGVPSLEGAPFRSSPVPRFLPSTSQARVRARHTKPHTFSALLQSPVQTTIRGVRNDTIPIIKSTLPTRMPFVMASWRLLDHC